MSTKERGIDLLPAEQPPIDLPQQGRKPWYTLLLSPLWLCLLIALLLRMWLVWRTHGVIDGDEALVGIQAENILRGEFPIYFYGIPYFGSLEAYLAALIFAITGPSVWALRAEPILVSLPLVWLTWRFAAALAEAAHLPAYAQTYFKTAAALLAAVPPLYDGVIELRTFGGYIETFVLMLLLLLSAFQLTRRWQANATFRELAWRWAGIGFLIGLGFWVYPLIISAVLAAFTWILGSRIVHIIKLHNPAPDGTKVPLSSAIGLSARGLLPALAAMPACILGFNPGIIWGATHKWSNIAYILNLGGSGTLRQHLHTIRQVAGAYTTCVAPRVISGALPVESTALAAMHSPLLIAGASCLLGAASLVLVSLLWHHPALIHIQHLIALPLLFGVFTAIIFCTGRNSIFSLISCSYDPVGRYATPLLLVLPYVFAAIFTVSCIFVHEHGKQAPPNPEHELTASQHFSSRICSPLALLAQGILVALLLVYLGAQAWTYGQTDAGYTFQSPYCRQAPANNDPVIAYLQQKHIHYAWGINWIAYAIVFKTNQSIIVADPMPFIPPVVNIDRFPANTNAVRHADRPSLLVFVSHDDPYPPLLRALDSASVTYQVSRFPSEPGTDILVVTPLSRTVTPFESKAISSVFSSCFN